MNRAEVLLLRCFVNEEDENDRLWRQNLEPTPKLRARRSQNRLRTPDRFRGRVADLVVAFGALFTLVFASVVVLVGVGVL